MDNQTKIELEAASFRRLVDHLGENTKVQNIDLMNLAGFCRNCLSKWYRAAAEDKGIDMDYEEARQIIYGMQYSEWKSKYQTEVLPGQQTAFDNTSDNNRLENMFKSEHLDHILQTRLQLNIICKSRVSNSFYHSMRKRLYRG